MSALVLAASLLALSACGDDDVMARCGLGTASSYGGQAYCLYRAGITEEGFTCPAGLPNLIELEGFDVCSESRELPDGAEDEFREELGIDDADASIPPADGSMPRDAGPESDGDPPVDAGETSCWDGWTAPIGRSEATARPSSPGLRLMFRYGRDDMGRAEIVMEELRESIPVPSSDGPFTPGESSGSWVELRDASDNTVFTAQIFELIAESLEAPGEDGGFMRAETCPSNPGFIGPILTPNDPAATHVVFFDEPWDGAQTFEGAQERLRIALP